jgi:hypothetical protein
MGSLTERYCARGDRCKLYDPETRRPQKLGRYHEGDLCRQCRQDKDVLEDAPNEYRELFHAARVLLDEGITEEYVIIPTLAFAANASENPNLRFVRDKFVEVHDKFARAGKASEAPRSKQWLKLDDQFFYNPYITLQPRAIVDGVLLVRDIPIETLCHVDEETDFTVRVDINVYDPSVPKDEVSVSYERHLHHFELLYKEGRGDISLREDPCSTTVQLIARPEDDWVGNQGPLPGPDAIGTMYDHLKERLKKRPKKTASKKWYNLIPSCVYWYVGGRGKVLDAPRGSALKRATYDLVKQHLLDPYEDKLPIKTRSVISRDAKKIQARILCMERKLHC